MPRFLCLLLAVTCLSLTTPALGGQPGHLRPADLRCEYQRDPLGLHEPSPRLNWTVESGRRAERQTAYRILVSSTPELLSEDSGDLWDTGRVESEQTTHIAYAGKPLPSRTACHWKVMTWDRDGNPSDWSRPASWEMGLLAPTDWSAQWIDASPTRAPIEIREAVYYTTDGKIRKDVTESVAAAVARGEPVAASNTALGDDPAYGVPRRLSLRYAVAGAALHADIAENATASLARDRIPYLRKSFNIDKPVRRARLYATALGVYEVYLNGQRVGDHHFAPGWTDYRKRVRYQTFDITPMLAPGRNALGAIVGPGWFSGRAGLFHAKAFYGSSPALLAQLEITYADGSTERIVSDGSWLRRDGPILAADMMDGEVHDARAELPDWCKPSHPGDGWSPVQTRPEQRTLEGTIDEPVRTLRELPALALTEPRPGAWTFDLGQNMVGVVRLRLRATPGAVITVRHAEMLTPEGTIYTANLRGAAATDTYICRGGEEESWQPRFTFHGFRYVEVTGLTERPALTAVTGIVLRSDLEPAGEFACSDPRLNQLQSNILWGLRGNYLSIPTDCPQRDERMGWMADTQVFAPTAAYNANVAPFMTKWMVDVADAQREDGAHSDVAPVMKGLTYGTPAWADAGTIVPWTVYQMYGDTRILERHISSMTRWVEWCRASSTGLIRDRARGNDYGDWLSIGADTPKDLIGTAYFARSADILARSLGTLGREDDARRYRDLFEQIRAAFIAKYVQPDGRITGDTQCAYLLALRFGLLPNNLIPPARARLVADLETRGWRLSTGFVGVGLLLPELHAGGETDAAYSLLLQDAFPSWLFSVKHGATTIWERWDGWTPERGVHPDASMNSFNHYSLGSCGEWFYSGLGGIAPATPGFRRILIRPCIADNLSWATARHRSPHGGIASRWELREGRLNLRVSIPANTTAAVVLPARAQEIQESGSPLGRSEGISNVERTANGTTIELGSGDYEFTARWDAESHASPAGHP